MKYKFSLTSKYLWRSLKKEIKKCKKIISTMLIVIVADYIECKLSNTYIIALWASWFLLWRWGLSIRSLTAFLSCHLVLILKTVSYLLLLSTNDSLRMIQSSKTKRFAPFNVGLDCIFTMLEATTKLTNIDWHIPIFTHQIPFCTIMIV